MGWRDDIALFEQNTRYQQWMQERVLGASSELADQLSYTLQATPDMNPEATVAMVLGGADFDLTQKANIAVAQAMMRAGRGADGNTLRDTAPINENDDRNILQSIGDGLFNTAKATTRSAFLLFDSVAETVTGVLGMPLGAPGFVERVQERGISGLADYLLDIPQSTSLWEAGSQLFTDGDVDVGSGWFVGGTVETGQAERQRQLVGTVDGPYGESAWTPGRGLASAATDLGLFDEESWAWNVTSGIVDGAIAVAADPSNLIPGIGWGDEVIQGVRAVGSRRLNRYVDFVTRADELAKQGGNAAEVARLRTRAMDALGANTAFKGFDDLNPQQVALRDMVMREAGMSPLMQSKSVDAAQFLSFLTKRSGRNLVERMVDENNIGRVMSLHKYKLGVTAAKDLADARTAEDVVKVYMRAFANPGQDLENLVGAVPSLGLFRKSDAGLWIRNNIGAHTRFFKMMPETSVLDTTNPQQFIFTLKQLLDVFPMGAGRSGARYNAQIADDLIDRSVRVLATGDKAQIFDLTNEIAENFAQMFKNLGYTDEMVESFTTWRKTSEQFQTFAQKQLLAGEKVDRIPLLVTQLLNGGVAIVDPQQLNNLVRGSTRLQQRIRTLTPGAKKFWDATDELAEVRVAHEAAREAGNVDEAIQLAKRERALVGDLAKMRNPDDAIPLQIKRGLTLAADAALSSVWKPFQLVRAAFISRVVGEEFVRVLASGTFGGRGRMMDYILATTRWGGRYELDAVGRRFNAVVSDADDLVARRADLLDEIDEIRAATPDADVTTLMNEVTSLDGQIRNVMEQVYDAEKNFHRGLLNKNQGAAYDSIVKNPKRILYQSRQAVPVSRFDDLKATEWREALSEHLLKLNHDPVMRRIAGGLDDKAVITINGQTATVAKHIDMNPYLSSEELITSWLMSNKEGSGYLKQMAAAYEAKAMKFDVDDINDVRKWVDEMHDELLYLTGGRRDPSGALIGADEDLLRVVADGTFRGEAVRFIDFDARNQRFNSMFDKHLEEFRNNEFAPNMIEHLGQTIHDQSKRNMFDNIAGWFFQGLYGTASDKLARSPTFRRIYWKQTVDLVDRLDPDEVAKLLEKARAANISPSLLKRLETRAKVASGTAKLDDIDDIAKASALAATRDLLFDASKRNAGFDQMRLLMPFGDAWKEVMQTWGRLFVNQRGANLYRGLRNAEAAMGMDAGPFGPGDLYGIDPLTGEYTATPDGRRENFVYTDPTSKEKRVMVPFSRQMSKLFAGSEFPGMDLGIPVQNFSIMGGVLPGIGPVADRLVDTVIPQDPSYDWLRELVFPFGEPAEASTVGGQQGIEEMVLPSWLRKASAFLPREGFTGWVANLINDIDDDPAYLSTRSQVYSQLVSTGRYGMGFAAQQQAQMDAERVARKLYAFRGLIQFASPGAPLSQYMAETEDGDVMASLLVEQLRDMENQLIDQGQSPSTALAIMLETYGPDVWLYSAPNTTSEYKGLAARDSWFEWYRTGLNREAVQRYDLFGGFFGPDEGDFSLDAYSRMRDDGLSGPATPQERYEMAARSLGYLAYNRFRDGLPSETNRTNMDRVLLARLRDNIEVTFNIDLESAERRSERERQINQARQIVTASGEGDRLASALMQQPGGESLRIYIEARERIQQEVIRETGVLNWQQAKAAAPYREYLRLLGARLSQDDPIFAKMFQFVFDGEMLDDLEVTV